MKVLVVLLFVFGAFTVNAELVSAQGLPPNLVTCGNPGQEMCQICDIVKLGMNILNFFVFFSLIFATLLFVNAGALYIFSPANPGNISRAHKIFSNTLVGILIILTSWLVIDTVMKNLYNEGNPEDGSGFGPWNTILCDQPMGATPITPATPPPPPVSGAPSAECSDLAAVAASYNARFPAENSPELGMLINCYLQDATVRNLYDGSQLYTIDRSSPSCNYTRGDPRCEADGECSHSRGSCHYGGSNRSNSLGAMAVDFNARDGSLAGEQALFNALQNAKNARNCNGVIVFENIPGRIHTHISTDSCRGD